MARTVLIKRGTHLPPWLALHSHMTQLAERIMESRKQPTSSSLVEPEETVETRKSELFELQVEGLSQHTFTEKTQTFFICYT